jgi:hypothetical protein
MSSSPIAESASGLPTAKRKVSVIATMAADETARSPLAAAPRRGLRLELSGQQRCRARRARSDDHKRGGTRVDRPEACTGRAKGTSHETHKIRRGELERLDVASGLAVTLALPPEMPDVGTIARGPGGRRRLAASHRATRLAPETTGADRDAGGPHLGCVADRAARADTRRAIRPDGFRHSFERRLRHGRPHRPGRRVFDLAGRVTRRVPLQVHELDNRWRTDAAFSWLTGPPYGVGPRRLLRALSTIDVAVLGGELAVPCTRNPLQRG